MAVRLYLTLSFLKNPSPYAFETVAQLICRSWFSDCSQAIILLCTKKTWNFRSQYMAWTYFNDIFIRRFALNWFRDVCHSAVLLNRNHFDGHCHCFSCENCGVQNFRVLYTKQSTVLFRDRERSKRQASALQLDLYSRKMHWFSVANDLISSSNRYNLVKSSKTAIIFYLLNKYSQLHYTLLNSEQHDCS